MTQQESVGFTVNGLGPFIACELTGVDLRGKRYTRRGALRYVECFNPVSGTIWGITPEGKRRKIVSIWN